MNIDVLDEDGASNIAHSEVFGKLKTYPKAEQGVSKQMFRIEYQCKFCGQTYSTAATLARHVHDCKK